VIHDGQQAVGVGRQIDARDARFLVDDVVDEAGILVRKTVVILLPDVGSQQVVQRCDIAPPRQLLSYLQPLGVRSPRLNSAGQKEQHSTRSEE